MILGSHNWGNEIEIWIINLKIVKSDLEVMKFLVVL